MSSNKRVRVLIADDNRTVRRGLRLLLENAPGIQVVGEVANGRDAVAVATSESVDVVLMDLQMPEMSGVEATRRISATPTAKTAAVIVMTSFAMDGLVTEAFDAGAVGYLLKGHDSDQLITAVKAAAQGQAVVSPRVAAPMLREFVRRGAHQPSATEAEALTTAERRVVSLLSSGTTSNEDIAASLHLSVHTVRSQLQSALKKVGLEDRTQLALWGVRNGLDQRSASSE